MDSGTLIVAAVFIVVCIVPFFITGRKYRKRKRQLFQSINQLAQQQNNKTTTQEMKGNFALALDEPAGKLFFARSKGEEIAAQSILLSEYGMCRLNNVIRIAEGGEKVTTRIELVFTPVSADSEQVVLDLYNEEHDSLTLAGELQVGEKWERLVAGYLGKPKSKPAMKPKKKRVA